jgi:hypothetical protein
MSREGRPTYEELDRMLWELEAEYEEVHDAVVSIRGWAIRLESLLSMHGIAVPDEDWNSQFL